MGAEALAPGCVPGVHGSLHTTAQTVTAARGRGGAKRTRPQPRGQAGISSL